MNIHEFSEEFRVSLRKTRLIQKRFPQIFSGKPTVFDGIKATLANGDDLAVWQLVELIENPGEILNLGKYAGPTDLVIRKLGSPQGQVAPKEVVANIMEAAKGESEALQILIAWLKLILPEKPVGHAFIATRLLLGLPLSLRKSEGARIPKALLNVRQHPDFAGWWRVEKQGARNVTLYQRPEKVFDL